MITIIIPEWMMFVLMGIMVLFTGLEFINVCLRIRIKKLEERWAADMKKMRNKR